jgi:hypothetical protein
VNSVRLSPPTANLAQTLLAWPFVISLVLLLANDMYLKLVYPGWLTGKLSDFAGIFLVAFLAFGLAPKRKYLIALGLALGFLCWKSPVSQPLIDGINSVSRYQVGRVVDYSDLIALVSIPFAWLLISRRRCFGDRFSPRQWLSIPVATLTALAISGTSIMLPGGEYSIRNTDSESVVSEFEIAAAIERVTDAYQLTCENCDENAEYTVYSNEDMLFSYALDEASNGIVFEVHVHKMKGLILRQPDYDLFDRFMRSLKSEMGRLSPSMEFVQNLSGPRYNY